MTVEVQWSELQRDPKGVAALTDRGDVRVRRRDGAALLLTAKIEPVRQRRVRWRPPAHCGTCSCTWHRRPQPQHFVDEFPWADVLPEQDRAQFVADFLRAFQASTEMGQWTPLAQAVGEWRATATVHADSELAEQLSGPVDDDFGAVPDPTKN